MPSSLGAGRRNDYSSAPDDKPNPPPPPSNYPLLRENLSNGQRLGSNASATSNAVYDALNASTWPPSSFAAPPVSSLSRAFPRALLKSSATAIGQCNSTSAHNIESPCTSTTNVGIAMASDSSPPSSGCHGNHGNHGNHKADRIPFEKTIPVKLSLRKRPRTRSQNAGSVQPLSGLVAKRLRRNYISSASATLANPTGTSERRRNDRFDTFAGFQLLADTLRQLHAASTEVRGVSGVFGGPVGNSDSTADTSTQTYPSLSPQGSENLSSPVEDLGIDASKALTAKTDDGNTDDGNADDGNADDGNTDDGNADDGSIEKGITGNGNVGTGRPQYLVDVGVELTRVNQELRELSRRLSDHSRTTCAAVSDIKRMITQWHGSTSSSSSCCSCSRPTDDADSVDASSAMRNSRKASPSLD